MSTGTIQRPPNRAGPGRPARRWRIVVAFVGAATLVMLLAVFVVTRSDDDAGGPQPAPSAVSEAPANVGPATTPSTAPSRAGQPTAAAFRFVPLWPFGSAQEAASWQATAGTGGHQPWHLDAAATALGFAGYLGYGDVDKVVRSTVDGRQAYVAIGAALPNGSLHIAADVHLVRMGTGADAPWEVVGTRDTTLTLDRPGYGSTVASPMTVGGRITGVDEQVVVTLHAVSGDLQAAPAAVPAGGVRAPWSVPVRFSGAAGRTVTVAAATGGHVAAVERFAVTGVRIGATG